MGINSDVIANVCPGVHTVRPLPPANRRGSDERSEEAAVMTISRPPPISSMEGICRGRALSNVVMDTIDVFFHPCGGRIALTASM